MPLDDSDLIKFLGDTKEALGRVDESQKATLRYLEAVNSNVKAAKEKFEAHEGDQYAHGIGLRLKVLAWLGAFASGALVFFSDLKKVFGLGGGHGG